MAQFWTITYNNKQKQFLLNEGDEEFINPFTLERLQRLVVDLNAIGKPPIITSFIASLLVLLVAMSGFMLLLFFTFALWAIIFLIIILLIQSTISNFFIKKYNAKLANLVREAVNDLRGTHHSRVLEPTLQCNNYIFTVWFVPNIVQFNLQVNGPDDPIPILELGGKPVESVETEFLVTQTIPQPSLQEISTIFPEAQKVYTEPNCEMLKEYEMEERETSPTEMNSTVADIRLPTSEGLFESGAETERKPLNQP